MRFLFLFPLLYSALAYAWFFKVYNYYFDFKTADQFSLLFSLIIPLLLSFRFFDKFNVKWTWPKVVLLIIIPVSLHSVIAYSLSRFDNTWLLMHISISICGLLAPSIATIKKSIAPVIAISLIWLIPFNFEKSQLKYFDKVVASIETRKGTGQIVKWKNDFWFHYNKQLLFSTIDSHIAKEALVAPVMHLDSSLKRVLIVGGESQLVLDELVKYQGLENITVVPYDVEFYNFVSKNSIRSSDDLDYGINLITDKSISEYVISANQLFDLIVIDLPNPQSTAFAAFYSEGFLKLCYERLSNDGYLVTRSLNLYTQQKEADPIITGLENNGFETLSYHAQVPSIGEVTWCIGSKKQTMVEMADKLKTVQPSVETKWWNNEAMNMMLSFGKAGYPNIDK
ncbi:MAG: hypothetical protein JXR03_19010 [Cyclobacteriaceae bacterium]